MTAVQRIAGRTAGLGLGLAVLLVVLYAILTLGGFRTAIVQSGSMRPHLAVGSLAIEETIRAREVKRGDVVTFMDPYERGKLVTHRVVRVLHTHHGLAYWTKGDANPARDPWALHFGGRVGRVIATVPYAGYVAAFARTREVRAIVILGAALAALALGLAHIWRKPEVVTA
jgi:signal peptidase I